jgi:hypothetical protein
MTPDYPTEMEKILTIFVCKLRQDYTTFCKILQSQYYDGILLIYGTYQKQKAPAADFQEPGTLFKSRNSSGVSCPCQSPHQLIIIKTEIVPVRGRYGLSFAKEPGYMSAFRTYKTGSSPVSPVEVKKRCYSSIHLGSSYPEKFIIANRTSKLMSFYLNCFWFCLFK